MPLSGDAYFCWHLHFLLLSLTVALLLTRKFNMHALVVVVSDLFRIVHAAVAYLDGISDEYITELVVFREA